MMPKKIKQKIFHWIIKRYYLNQWNKRSLLIHTTSSDMWDLIVLKRESLRNLLISVLEKKRIHSSTTAINAVFHQHQDTYFMAAFNLFSPHICLVVHWHLPISYQKPLQLSLAKKTGPLPNGWIPWFGVSRQHSGVSLEQYFQTEIRNLYQNYDGE